MTRIDRAAWKRIKAGVAEPKTVTVFKGRATGSTMGVLESNPELVDELRFADGNRLKASGPRAPAFKGRSVGPSTRFSAEELFRNNDQVTYLAQRHWLRALLPAK